MDRYIPEFVTRFHKYHERCCCPTCNLYGAENVAVTRVWQHEQRESLALRCERACDEILFNAEAFILQTDRADFQTALTLSLFEQALNQHSINLCIESHLSFDESLYCLGILASKSATLDASASDALAQLADVEKELSRLAQQGIIHQQIALMPALPAIQLRAFAALGEMSLPLTLTTSENRIFRLALTELALFSPAQLAERQQEMNQLWRGRCAPVFELQSHILRNYLLFRLYDQPFRVDATHRPGQQYLTLMQDIYLLKMLSAVLISLDLPLDRPHLVKIFSAFATATEKKTVRKKGGIEVCEEADSVAFGLALLQI